MFVYSEVNSFILRILTGHAVFLQSPGIMNNLLGEILKNFQQLFFGFNPGLMG